MVILSINGTVVDTKLCTLNIINVVMHSKEAAVDMKLCTLNIINVLMHIRALLWTRSCAHWGMFPGETQGLAPESLWPHIFIS